MVARIGRSAWLRTLVGSVALLVATACGNDEGTPDAAAGDDDIGAQTTADPADTAEPSGDPIRFTSTFGPPNLLEAACAADACVFPLTRESSVASGALTGTSVSGGAGFPLTGGGYAGVGIRRFEGAVDGCGSGTMLVTEVIVSSDGTQASGTWSIVESSGTEGLAGVAGGGTFEASQEADGSGVAEAVGTIDCGPG